MPHEIQEEYLNKIKDLKKLNKDIKNSFDELLDVLTDLSDAVSLKFDSDTLFELIANLIDNIFSYILTNEFFSF